MVFLKMIDMVGSVVVVVVMVTMESVRASLAPLQGSHLAISIDKFASFHRNFKSPTSKICLARSSSSLSKARVSASFSTLKVSKSVAFTLGSKEICYRGWQLQMLANY